MNNSTEDKALVKSTGRGVIYISFAKMWFLVTGYAMYFVLARLFKWYVGGDVEAGQELFGEYSLIFTGVSIINNGIITGTIQSVSKFTAEDESGAGAVRKTGLLVQGGIGALLGVFYAIIAGFLAAYWKKPELAYLMRLSAGVIVAYSFYGVFIGSLNGRRLFGRQALFDISYATFKTGLIIGLVLAGFEVLGTVVGFLMAAALVAVAAGIASRAKGEGFFPVKRFFKFAGVIIIYSFILNLVMMLDLMLLPGLVEGENGSVLAAQYKSMQVLSLIPYQAVLSIAFVIFPMISKVTFAQEEDKAQRYVRKTLRLTTILIVGLAVVFAALPSQILGFMFPPEYIPAAPALRILPFGVSAFGLMVVGNTVLNAAGHTWKAMIVVLSGVAVMVAVVLTAVPLVEPGVKSLQATAAGTTAGMVTALLICGVFVYRRFGTFWPLATIVRVLLAAGSAIALGYFLPVAGKLFTLIECGAVLVVYFTVLIVLREFKKEDLMQFKQVIKKG